MLAGFGYQLSAARRRGAIRPLSTVAVEQGRATNPLSLSENRSQTNHEPLRKREQIRAERSGSLPVTDRGYSTLSDRVGGRE